MTIQEIEDKIVELQGKQLPLFTKRDKLNDQIVRIGKQIEKLLEQKDKEEMSTPMTKEQEMEYFLFEDGRVSGDRYKAREKYWQDKGLWHSGYFPDLGQINLKVMLYKGEHDNLEQTLSVLNEVIPFLKEKDGVKLLSVFEHTCSENGSYQIKITENEYSFVVFRYSRKSVVKSFDNLRDLIKYIQEFHYYESSFGEDEE